MESITNQAHVSFSYEGSEVVKTNHSNVVTSSMKDKYGVSVEKTSTTDCFRAGESITYFVHITNTGCGCLGRFVVSDDLGGEGLITYIEGSARLFINGSMNEINPTNISPLEFTITERLERDAEMIIQYNALVNSDISSEVESITNSVTVTGYPCGCECNNTNSDCITDTASLTIEKCEFAEVLITKAISKDNLCCDDEIDYFITLTNTGTVDATNVIVTDSLPNTFKTTEIHMENNGNHYQFLASEYSIDDANFLTLPNETGTEILVPALAPGVDNTTRIRIHGHM